MNNITPSGKNIKIAAIVAFSVLFFLLATGVYLLNTSQKSNSLIPFFSNTGSVRNDRTNNNNSNDQRVYPTTIKRSSSDDVTKADKEEVWNNIAKKTETMPTSELNRSEKPQHFYDQKLGDYVIRIKATVGKVISPGKTLELQLDSGETLRGQTDEDTLLADAWFGIDANGIIVLTQYEKTDISNIEKIKQGDKVEVAFAEKDLNSKNTILLTELVLLQ